MSSYPTWVCIDEARWQSAEETNGIPDFAASCAAAGHWRLRWRGVTQQRRFGSLTAVKAHAQLCAGSLAGLRDALADELARNGDADSLMPIIEHAVAEIAARTP